MRDYPVYRSLTDVARELENSLRTRTQGWVLWDGVSPLIRNNLYEINFITTGTLWT
jgi:hypothetical protein